MNRELGRSLVTGAAGFIGSHLVEELCRQGVQVRALARYTSRGFRGWLDEVDNLYADQIETVFGDVRDPEQMRTVANGCDTVFHLAALVGIPYSYAAPRQNLEINTTGTLNLLEAARDAEARRFVHVSSSEVYGTARYVPIDEDHPLTGQSPYAASKVAAEQLIVSYVRSYDLPAVIVRPFNTFGPRQSMRAVIPAIITQALWSDRIRLGALDPTRDFTFVRDTACGLLQAGREPGIEGGVFNLGHGSEIAIGELAETILAMVGRDVPVECEGVRLRPAASEVERLCADADRARTALRWDPKYSLDEGLSLTVEWIRDRGVRHLPEQFVL